MPDFAAVQDWMCEPTILKKTGLTVPEHQRRTVESYLNLRNDAPDIPWAPVLQGWKTSDYLRHVEMYERGGVALDQLPVVGIGSICRRQETDGAVEIIQTIAALGIRLHGFGIKALGLRKVAHLLHTADSMAWSFNARKAGVQLPGHTHKNCANCLEFALIWRKRLLLSLSPQVKGVDG